MILGRCCKCKQVEPVTIKGLAASTGVTEWEYGPGSLWCQHYGADRISGIRFDWTADDRFVYRVPQDDYFYSINWPIWRSRRHPITRAFTPNCSECLTLVKLDSTDGTEFESATMAGVFAYPEIFQNQPTGGYYPLNLTRLTGPVGLSGGDYLMPHSVDPAVEWIDYTTDTANKEYTLHAHTMQGGNMYIRTLTSLETITIPYNATAAVVEALFEATADCTAATATGGPWPGTAIDLEVTWSQSDGDIGWLRFDPRYTAGGSGSCLFQWNAATSTWVLVSDTCNPGPAEEPLTSGSYDGELRAGTCPVSFPPPASATRNTRAAAVSWSTSTGAITSSVGHVFGLSNGTAPAKLIAETAGTVPTYTRLGSSEVQTDMYAGASNSVLIFGYSGQDQRTVEGWTVGSPWSRIWRRYTNGEPLYGGRCAWAGGLAQSGKVAIYVKKRTYNSSTKTGVIADIAAGTLTEFDVDEVSTNTQYNNNASSGILFDGSGSDLLTTAYSRVFAPATNPSYTIGYNLGGSQFRTPSKRLLLGYADEAFGADASRIYGSHFPSVGASAPFTWSNSNNTNPPVTGGLAVAGSIARVYRWEWYSSPIERYDAGEFRIRFTPATSTGLASQVTSWLDWQCSAADIENAVLAIWPQNTEGVTTNVTVNPFGFGGTNVTDNSPAPSLIETNISIHFRAASTLGFIPAAYVSPGRVSIEVRNLATIPSTGGIAAYSATDASVSWSRNFGSTASPAKTYQQPSGGWLRGARLYVYGPVVDNEL